MSAPLWTAEAVAAATDGRLKGRRGWTASGVSIDSRTVAPGDLFVALVGPNNDGHDYAVDALRNGAAAVMVARPVDGMPDDWPRLETDDTLQALNALGVAARDRSEAKRIAVTGSVGKTGTKEMLRVALGAAAATHASAASYNNLWGVPLTLARMPAATQFGVFEIGMNHAGEIRPLTRLVLPHVAIVTTVQPVHLEFFDSVDGIADAKAEIFEGLTGPKIAIVNGEIAHTDRLVRAAERAGASAVLRFGENKGCDVRLTRCAAEGDGLRVGADVTGTAIDYVLRLAGRHQAVNSLAVLAAVKAVGADMEAAAAALGSMTALKGRGETHTVPVQGGAITVIDESYNANPASMAAALKTLGAHVAAPGGRRIAVMGDMLELGPGGPDMHAALAETVESEGIDLVFASGPLMQHLWDAVPADRRGAYGPQSSALEGPLVDAVRPGDVIMIKGSLGSKMAPLVAALLALHHSQTTRAGGAG